MHVLLKRAVCLELQLLLEEFVKQRKYFSVYQLNERIRCFEFSPEEAKIRPTPITEELSICESGEHGC